MKKIVTYIMFFFVWHPHVLVARVIERTVAVSVVEERINGKKFSHRIDVINGAKKEFWAIDGVQVNQQEFEDTLLEQEMAERRTEREKDREQREQELQFVTQAQRAVLTRLVRVLIKNIELWLTKLHASHLQPYWSYHEQGIASSDQLTYLKDELMPQAYKLLEQEALASELQDIAHNLEPFIERLARFYRETIMHAQETADDTKLLKELLQDLSIHQP